VEFQHFRNRRSGEVQTEEPKEAWWVREIDGASGDFYYWHSVTRETLWELPALPTLAASSTDPWQGSTSSSSTAPVHHPSPFRPEDVLNEPGDIDPVNAWIEVMQPGSTSIVKGFRNFRTGVWEENLPADASARWTGIKDTENNEWYYIFKGGDGYPEVEVGTVFWDIPGRCKKECMPQMREHLESPPEWWREVGAPVAVVGLEEQTRYNGMLGTIVFCDCVEWFYVELPAVLGACKLGLRPRNMAQLPLQSIVEFQGLRSHSQINGDIGQVCAVRPETGRYVVRIRDGSRLDVKPINLKPRCRLWEISNPSYSRLTWRKEEKCLFIDSEGSHWYYYLHLPMGFDLTTLPTPKAWPLLVYLHGTGGGSFFTYSKVSLNTVGLQFAAANFIVVSPKCEWDWRASPSRWCLELIKTLRAAEWVDHQRVYLTGCSMGGMGTWEVGASAPDVFAALAPVAAHHKEKMAGYISQQLRNVPILTIYSDIDETCPLVREAPLYFLFRNHFDFNQRNYSVDHTKIHEDAYCNSDSFYHWLLKRRSMAE